MDSRNIYVIANVDLYCAQRDMLQNLEAYD